METLLAFGALFMFLFADKIPAGVRRFLNFDPLYQKYGEKYGVDWRLLKAIAQVESSENPQAVNPADPSYGLMQILFPQSLNIENWPPKNSVELMEPDYNVSVGAQILAWNIRSYGFYRGVAVYNSWGSRLNPELGPFDNQSYVDKVMAAYAQLGGTHNV